MQIIGPMSVAPVTCLYVACVRAQLCGKLQHRPAFPGHPEWTCYGLRKPSSSWLMAVYCLPLPPWHYCLILCLLLGSMSHSSAPSAFLLCLFYCTFWKQCWEIKKGDWVACSWLSSGSILYVRGKAVSIFPFCLSKAIYMIFIFTNAGLDSPGEQSEIKGLAQGPDDEIILPSLGFQMVIFKSEALHHTTPLHGLLYLQYSL